MIIVARRFPRDEKAARARLLQSCERPGFAEDALYSFPRGGATIEGPGVNLAREASRVWGNMRYGTEIVRDDDETVQIRGWAYDVEANNKSSAEDFFKKLVQRKMGKQTVWVKPDERDMRELINRRGAILERNSLLKLLPPDLIEEAKECCKETMRRAAKHRPDESREKLVTAFRELGITAEMIVTQLLHHPLHQITPDEIAQLRRIYKAIQEGAATWAEYAQSPRDREHGSISVDAIKPAAEANRGHGDTKLDTVAKSPAASAADDDQKPLPY